ncbi:MAG: hypothetical protein K2X66_13830 [Cyanobacteria bacterium]|nr:hypothetical protein [Cyanobacteriota bacterium]
MSSGHSSILQKLSGTLHFREGQLKNYPNREVAFLINQGVLEKSSTSDWFCENCEETHPITVINEIELKACPEDLTASFVQVLPEDKIIWHWNWEKLKAKICLQNLLEPLNLEKMTGLFPIGASTQKMVFISDVSNYSEMINLAKQVSLDFQKYEIFLIHPGLLILNTAQQREINLLNVQYCSLEQIMNTQWQLPWLSHSPEEEPNLILNPSSLTISLFGESFTFPTRQTFLFKTARILIAAKGNIVSESEFNNQYYQLSLKSTRAGISVGNYVGKAENLLRKAFPRILEKKNLFQNVYGEGYKLNQEFLPVKILT